MTRSGRSGEQGSVTAELAIGLTGVASVLVVLLATVSTAQAQLRVVDAAGAGARAAARGEADVAALTRRLAGPGAVATVNHAAGAVTVEVSAPVQLPLPGAPRVTVRGRAVSPAEPQVVGP